MLDLIQLHAWLIPNIDIYFENSFNLFSQFQHRARKCHAESQVKQPRQAFQKIQSISLFRGWTFEAVGGLYTYL